MLRNLLILTFGMLFLMLGIGYFTADPASRERPSQAQVLQLFDTIALSGFGEGGPTGTGPYLRRWQGPVQVALIGTPTVRDKSEKEKSDSPADSGRPAERPWKDAVADMITVYDALPNLDVSITAETPFSREVPAGTSLAIVTVPADAMDDLLPTLPPKAASSLGSNRQGCAVLGAEAAVLETVTILIADDISAGRRASCFGESLATALGFTIGEKASGDVFRVRQDGLMFHGLGRMAAALVYDPALQPGMGRDQARAAAAEVLKRKGLE